MGARVEACTSRVQALDLGFRVRVGGIQGLSCTSRWCLLISSAV